jgi:hypothetical protein
VLSNVAWYRATAVLVGIDGRYGSWDEEGRPVGRSVGRLSMSEKAPDAKSESEPAQRQRFRKHDRSSTETW